MMSKERAAEIAKDRRAGIYRASYQQQAAKIERDKKDAAVKRAERARKTVA